MLPKDIIALIEKETQTIWHITELLSKLESANNGSITLSTSTLHYFAQQISNHRSNIMEHVEALNVSSQASVCSDP